MNKLSKKSVNTVIICICSIVIIAFIALGILDSKTGNKVLNQINNNTQDLSNNVTQSSKIQLTEAFVKRVVDGDTIVVTIDDKDYKVRFIGVNTPESTTKIEPYGKEASEYTTKQLTGKTVYLEKDISETDKYGRLLRYIWLEKPDEVTKDEIVNKMFNAKLLIDGFAQVATYPPDVKYVDYFKELGSQARKNSIGLWKDK